MTFDSFVYPLQPTCTATYSTPSLGPESSVAMLDGHCIQFPGQRSPAVESVISLEDDGLLFGM